MLTSHITQCNIIIDDANMEIEELLNIYYATDNDPNSDAADDSSADDNPIAPDNAASKDCYAIINELSLLIIFLVTYIGNEA
jgi:hypothetical protein